MTRFLRPRRLAIITALTVMWCILWGEFSIANLISGLIVAIGISMTGIDTPARGGVRIWPLLTLLWLVAVDLARSTVDVAKEILTPTDYTQESVVAACLPVQSHKHFLLLTVAITLTPGTAVVDGDEEKDCLYLHLLHARRKDETLAHATRLAKLACEALPVKDPTDPEPTSSGEPAPAESTQAESTEHPA